MPTAYEEPTLASIASTMGTEVIRLRDPKDLNITWASTLAGSKAEPHETHVYQYPLGLALVILLFLSFRGMARNKDLV